MNKNKKSGNENFNGNNCNTKQKILKKRRCLNPKTKQIKDELFEKFNFFDPDDLIQVKYEMIRRVNKDGWTIKKATESFGFSRPSFYKAKNQFEKYGIIGLIPGKTGPKKPHKLSSKVIEYIQTMTQQNPKIKAQTITDAIKKKFKVNIEKRSIYRALQKIKKKKRKKQKT